MPGEARQEMLLLYRATVEGRSGMRVRRLMGATAVGGLVAYVLLARPWHLRWGATAPEAGEPLPGDDLIAILHEGRAKTAALRMARGEEKRLAG